jgi:GNAT superfamily N-acetyltransferase
MEDRMAERRIEGVYGTALLHPGLPHAWNLNFIRLDAQELPPSIDPLVEEADLVMAAAGLAHRKFNVGSEPLGSHLAPEFRLSGWRVFERLVMVHRGTTPPGGAPHDVAEVDSDALLPKWEMGIRSAPWAINNEPAVLQQLEAHRLRETAAQVRYFAAWVDGRPVSECSLFTSAEIAQVESVHTETEYRGRGLAASVIRTAVDRARKTGHEVIFLLADAHGTSQQLYRGLGFTEAGRVWAFLRLPPG